ncbi:MAG: methyltransferase [Candidatus Thermoplasmatota archaeon]|nr:methyltransferase [Candidatus Thermoplasmatota archaeon]
MKVKRELDIGVHEGVYEPSDDTYLLLDIIQLEGQKEILEIGCGSGIISLHCSAQGCNVLSVDRDEKALKNTKINAKKNNLDISVRKSHLFSNINKDDWNIIIFNPPYLPRDEFLSKDDRWDGGKKGDEIIVRFLAKAKDYLKKDGKLFMCYSSLSPKERIKNIIDKRYEIVNFEKKEFFFETLYGLELNKRKR